MSVQYMLHIRVIALCTCYLVDPMFNAQLIEPRYG